jgi:hypothetical protein
VLTTEFKLIFYGSGEPIVSIRLESLRKVAGIGTMSGGDRTMQRQRQCGDKDNAHPSITASSFADCGDGNGDGKPVTGHPSKVHPGSRTRLFQPALSQE